MGETLVFDVETDGFDPSIVYVLGILNYDTDEFTSYIKDEVADGILRLLEADLLIGHNIIKYDIPVIEKLTDGVIEFSKDKLVDTLVLSREVFPKMLRHGLKNWGILLESPKGEFKKFDMYYEEMIPYCEQDCRLTKLVLDRCLHVKEEKAKGHIK